jgi:hypothetical protein
MSETFQCNICGQQAGFRKMPNDVWRTITCLRCGEFQVTDDIWLSLKFNPYNREILSGWIQEQNYIGITPRISFDNAEHLTMLRKPGLKERAERYLLASIAKGQHLHSEFLSDGEDLIGVTYSATRKEMLLIRNYLIDEGLLHHSGQSLCSVTPKGHIAADELRGHRAKSSQGFVAMWFGEEVGAIYDDAIDPAIAQAGYKPMRIDRKEDVVKIDDEILSEIRRSALVVADFTGHRGGVYFEAGFAMGLGIPIVWTCREDHMEKLHFDIRQYNCLSWKDATDFAPNLQKRIEGYLGRGPVIDHQ